MPANAAYPNRQPIRRAGFATPAPMANVPVGYGGTTTTAKRSSQDFQPTIDRERTRNAMGAAIYSANTPLPSRPVTAPSAGFLTAAPALSPVTPYVPEPVTNPAAPPAPVPMMPPTTPAAPAGFIPQVAPVGNASPVAPVTATPAPAPARAGFLAGAPVPAMNVPMIPEGREYGGAHMPQGYAPNFVRNDADGSSIPLSTVTPQDAEASARAAKAVYVARQASIADTPTTRKERFQDDANNRANQESQAYSSYMSQGGPEIQRQHSQFLKERDDAVKRQQHLEDLLIRFGHGDAVREDQNDRTDARLDTREKGTQLRFDTARGDKAKQAGDALDYRKGRDAAKDLATARRHFDKTNSARERAGLDPLPWTKPPSAAPTTRPSVGAGAQGDSGDAGAVGPTGFLKPRKREPVPMGF